MLKAQIIILFSEIIQKDKSQVTIKESNRFLIKICLILKDLKRGTSLKQKEELNAIYNFKVEQHKFKFRKLKRIAYVLISSLSLSPINLYSDSLFLFYLQNQLSPSIPSIISKFSQNYLHSFPMDHLISISSPQVPSTPLFNTKKNFDICGEYIEIFSVNCDQNNKANKSPDTSFKPFQTPTTYHYGPMTPWQQIKNERTSYICEKIKLNFFTQDQHAFLKQNQYFKSKVITKEKIGLKLDRFGKKIYSFKHVKSEKITGLDNAKN